VRAGVRAVRRELPEDGWISPTTRYRLLPSGFIRALDLATRAERVLRRVVGTCGTCEAHGQDHAHKKCLHWDPPKVTSHWNGRSQRKVPVVEAWMMQDGMMWGMGVGHLLVAVLVLLAIAALIKYVFFR
jgi:hypothetical protein